MTVFQVTLTAQDLNYIISRLGQTDRDERIKRILLSATGVPDVRARSAPDQP